MASIGAFTFPARRTAVDVQTSLVEGRTRKIIRVDTILLGSGSLADFLTEVSNLEAEVEKLDRGEATLSVTAGRYYGGRRLSVQRTLDEAARFAAFEIRLLTEDRYERSLDLHEATKVLTASGDTLIVDHAGNTLARPELTLTAVGNLVRPTLSDGERSIVYEDTLAAGGSLVFDSDLQTALLNGTQNVLPKTSGSFPLLSPGNTTITYTDDPTSSHSGTLLVRFRDLWV